MRIGLLLVSILLLLGITSAGCGSECSRQERLAREQPVVTQIDGCTVYRFFDDCRIHYVSKCSGFSSTSSPKSEGKVTRYEAIPTVNR